MRLVVCVGGVVVDAIALILSDDVARRGSKIWRGAWGVLWHVRCFSITVFTYSIVIVVLNVVCVFEDWSIMRYWRSHVAHRQCHSDVSPARRRGCIDKIVRTVGMLPYYMLFAMFQD